MQEHTANYYFLKRFLHPQPYTGYRQSIVNLLINKNKGPNNGKFMFVKERTGLWFFPKGHLVGNDITGSFFESVSQNLENELGLHGMRIFEIKPSFTQLAYIFDFERQKYNIERQAYERAKKNPTKGKLYHLAMMEYRGTEIFPVNNDSKVLAANWVTKEEGKILLESIYKELGRFKFFTESTAVFYGRFFEKIITTYQNLEFLKTNKNPFQAGLI